MAICLLCGAGLTLPTKRAAKETLSVVALAVLSQLNHVAQRRPLHVEAQLVASETTACTEVTSPLSEVQINRSIKVKTLGTKHLAYHLPLKLSSTLLSDRLNEWGRGSSA